MTIYYSATTNAFYDSQVYNVNNIPEDKVAVAESTYKNLMAQQCAGRVIVAAADGTPTTIAQTCGPCTSTKYATKTELTNGLAAKANDSNVVHKTGDETINGVKSFGSVIKATNGTVQVGADTGYSVTFNYNGNITSKQARGTYNIFFPEGSGTLALTSDINGKANDSDVVHKTGNETIRGTKTFSNRISFPSGYYITTDTNDNSLRIIRDGSNHGNNYKVIIQGDTGKFFAPNGFIGNLQGNADTATSANDPNAVHKTGNETINGIKMFTDAIHKKNSALDLQVNPSSDQFNSFLFTDKNNAVMGYLEHIQTTSGVNAMGLYAKDKSNKTHGIQVTSENNVIPLGDGVVNLGLSGAKWKNVYSTNNITNKVISYSVTSHDNTSSMTVSGGSSWDTGSTLFLYGNSHSNYPGAFNLTAKNTTNESKLIGFPNGTLTWDGKNLITTEFVKGTNYWYRKHSDGFIEMGGFTNCGDKTGSAVATNMPLAFSNTNYTLLVQLTRGTVGGDRWGDDYMLPFTQKKTTTGFVVYSNHLSETGSNGGGYDWYACGY